MKAKLPARRPTVGLRPPGGSGRGHRLPGHQARFGRKEGLEKENAETLEKIASLYLILISYQFIINRAIFSTHNWSKKFFFTISLYCVSVFVNYFCSCLLTHCGKSVIL